MGVRRVHLGAAYENNRPQAILVALKAVVPLLLCGRSRKYAAEITRLMLDLHCRWPRQVRPRVRCRVSVAIAVCCRRAVQPRRAHVGRECACCGVAEMTRAMQGTNKPWDMEHENINASIKRVCASERLLLSYLIS